MWEFAEKNGKQLEHPDQGPAFTPTEEPFGVDHKQL